MYLDYHAGDTYAIFDWRALLSQYPFAFGTWVLPYWVRNLLLLT